MSQTTTTTNSGGTEVTPYREQRPFLRTDKRYYGFISGVGAGKTFSGIIRTILNMTEWNPGEMGAIVAPTRQMVVNVIIPEMRDLGLFEEPIGWEYNSAHSDEPGIHTPEGSRALILSADNQKTIERLRGLNLAWWWMDEEAIIEPRAREILMQRLRAGSYRNGCITTTPKGKNHTYEFFVGDTDAGKEALGEATLYEADDRRAVVGVPTSANPYTPDDYKDAMESDLPEDLRAQEVRGEFVEIGSGVFRREMFEFINPSDVREDAKLQTVIGVDPAATVDAQAAEENDADYWGVCVVQIDKFKNTVYVVDTARRRGMSLSEGVNWLREIQRNASRSAKVFIESNQAQVYLQNALKDAGVNAIPVKTTSNKENRLVDLTIPISGQTVRFVDWNTDKPAGVEHPYGELVNEALAFPEGGHDDLLDALYLAVDNSSVAWGTGMIGGEAYGNRGE